MERRKNLGEGETRLKNEGIKKLFFEQISLKDIKVLHSFLPILKHNEINVWPIITEIQTSYPHITLVISKSNFSSLEMESFVLKADTILAESPFGIPEPEAATLMNNNLIDMILVPLLVFDETGHRVGYGKGFYDRFLSKCSKEAVKVGLSLEEPVQKITDTHDGDVVLDHCITPERVYSFAPR